MADRERRIRRVDEVFAEPVGDQLVLLHPGTDAFVRLNPAGVLLWDVLEQPRTAQELAGALLERYGIEQEDALVDAAAFIEEVVGCGVAEDADRP